VGDATFYEPRQPYQNHYYRRYRMGFRCVRKIATSDRYFHHVCPQFGRPSVRMESARTGRIFMKFNTWGISENLSRKSKFHSNLTWTTGTLHEDLCTLIITFRWILKITNVSNKSCKENQNTLLGSAPTPPSGNHAVYEITYSQRGHTWQYGAEKTGSASCIMKAWIKKDTHMFNTHCC
jgi:hypothetical protein